MEDSIKFDTQYDTWRQDKYLDQKRKYFTSNGTVDDLRLKIAEYNPLDGEILRPKWPKYFMRLAHIVASRSNCMKKSVGAIIVNENQQIVATGYNGTPFGFKNCFEGGCKRCNDFTNKQGENLDL